MNQVTNFAARVAPGWAHHGAGHSGPGLHLPVLPARGHRKIMGRTEAFLGPIAGTASPVRPRNQTLTGLTSG